MKRTILKGRYIKSLKQEDERMICTLIDIDLHKIDRTVVALTNTQTIRD